MVLDVSEENDTPLEGDVWLSTTSMVVYGLSTHGGGNGYGVMCIVVGRTVEVNCVVCVRGKKHNSREVYTSPMSSC